MKTIKARRINDVESFTLQIYGEDNKSVNIEVEKSDFKSLTTIFKRNKIKYEVEGPF
jgi:ribosomal protein L25 (general stress protein Ctc)